MPNSCISTTTYPAQSEMYPWRRGPYTFAESVNEASITSPLNKKLSAGAAEFVPSFAESVNEVPIMKPINKKLSAGAPEFVPRWARNDNVISTSYNAGNCFQISLDGYSDESEDDEPQFPKVALSKTTTKIAETPASAKLLPTMERADAVAGKDEQTSDESDTDKHSIEPEIKTGTQRPWRVPGGNMGQTTDVESGSSEMSVEETPISNLPWRSSSLGRQALSKVAPSAKLPPWKRTAWKPPTLDPEDEASSDNQPPPASSGTTDTGASCTTSDSDANTSEDLASDEDRMNLETREHESDIVKEKLVAKEDCVNFEENSKCETEPEAEEDTLQNRAPDQSVPGVWELLKWRSAVISDEVSAHEVPGRLIAIAEPTTEPQGPQSPPQRKPLQCRTKQSPQTSLVAHSSSSPKSRRQEAVQQAKMELPCESRGEAPTSANKNKLQISDNSWAAKQRARRGLGAESSDEEVVRAMKSILNKLTIEKFPQLYQQMTCCGIRTDYHLEQLIQEVFEKATTQHHFIDMYADLCKELHTHFVQNPIVDSPKLSFKKILLNACQTSFEKNLSPPANLAEMSPEERTAAEFEYKMRTIGNIRLVGALLVRKMLASKVMFAIIEELLSKPTSEALETLAALLTVVGGEFDRPTFANRTALNAIFLQVQALAKKKSTASRVRCLLKDVLDLRAAGWLDKKPKKMEKPTTLGEVHEKAAMENGSPIASTSRASPEEWTTVPQRSAAVQPAASVGNPSKTFAEAKGRSGIATKAQTLPIKATPDDQLRKENFDSKTCHEEVAKALTELFVSYDIEEAVLCVVDLGVPASHQARELCDVLSVTSEEGSAEKRKIGFTFVAKLFLGGHWRRSALADGLRSFVEDICADLKFDVPNLPQILREELHPALVPAVEAGLLKASQHQSLATPTF